MINIKTPIIPHAIQRVGIDDKLDLEAICTFAALGFFLDDDTYFKGSKALKPAHDYVLDGNQIVSAKPYFTWHNQGQFTTLNDATAAFKETFHAILSQATKGKNVILPLSGGLDSRSLAAGLKHVGAPVQTYSYSFEGGLDETFYARKIAAAENFPMHDLTIPKGYLWDCIDELAHINGCYSEFTHPRQMAHIQRYASWGEVFLLGHWGDVLFDNMGVDPHLPTDQQVALLLKKVVKKGGMELGQALWNAWGLQGTFNAYLLERLRTLLNRIPEGNDANTRLRAFKSLYWAPRWTSVNLSVFEQVRPLCLPYYDNAMCELICTIPESFLGRRLIQIEYLKQYAPELARIEWQEKRPYNLYNYHKRTPLRTLPYRAFQKVKRTLQPKKFVQSNWELQFLGEKNEALLKERLYHEKAFAEWIPKTVVDDMYKRFKQESPVYYSHSVSMLLTLSLFSKHFKK